MTKIAPIHCIGIVNRGEAAMRCIRAVKSLRVQEDSDIKVLALYTDVDSDAPFVRHADLALRLKVKTTPVAAYLDHDLLIETLRRGGADAVWPGWGFVAEHADFADRIEREGMRFLGPSGDTMRRLGDKIASKLLAESVHVPVTAWSQGCVESEDAAASWGVKIGYPLVVKASAGGGGRGIRMVESEEGLLDAFRSARSEARNAFGDDRLFMEKKVSGGRHIEVQIAADRHGNVIALGCRDCSVQRRHQKVIEEAPPAGLASQQLRDLQECAVRLAKHVGYSGVGTVEFLVTGSEFFFLEMNPRLQVEHGITEEITGIDIVQLQVKIGRGECLPQALPAIAMTSECVAIEARVCAENPDAGFLPAPGKIVRFDPALGPRIRIDTGVVSGSTVPAAFDSLIAKVISVGDSRKEAIGRLSSALRDFDLVIEGGATNKGYLLELLDAPDYQRGGVDTGWLDRWNEERAPQAEFAAEALAVAGILAYQDDRQVHRRNFFSDPSGVSPTKAPASTGQQIDLAYGGEQYRLEIFAIGSWRYRVHLDGVVLPATLLDEGKHAARIMIGERQFRVLYDIGDAGIRVEVEGCAHYFGRQTAGQVRASTPSMMVAVHVKIGDVVQVGQSLGLLEAMKMEIGFDAPVGGVVTEVRVQRGQQIAAGDVLLVIEPAKDKSGSEPLHSRLQFAPERDPLATLFDVDPATGDLITPNLKAAEVSETQMRRMAINATYEEVRRLVLGYDANPKRVEQLAAFLEAPLPDDLAKAFRLELAEIRSGLLQFADVEQLFFRGPRVLSSGELGMSNNAGLRFFVRRMRAEGTGLDEEILSLIRGALQHYGVSNLVYGERIERALLRLFASQQNPALRYRIVVAVLRRIMSLAVSGVDLSQDRALADALSRIAEMRGLVPNDLADLAVDARYTIFEEPEIEQHASNVTERLERWLAVSENDPAAPPEEVLRELAIAPLRIFRRVEAWLSEEDFVHRTIALAAHLWRFYAPLRVSEVRSQLVEDFWIQQVRLEDGRVSLGCVASSTTLVQAVRALRTLAEEISKEDKTWRLHAFELLLPTRANDDFENAVATLAPEVELGFPAQRFTLSAIAVANSAKHYTWMRNDEGVISAADLHEMHPEAALRVDLQRLSGFHLERIASGDGVYSFYARSQQVAEDERIFVLADVRGHVSLSEPEGATLIPIFERAFYSATRTLRGILGERDPQRRLHWNRIVIFVGNRIFLDPKIAQHLSRRLAPATRHLGLEKVIVRLCLLDREDTTRAPQSVEVVISDPTGSRMEIGWRTPRSRPLAPAHAYERKVMTARARSVVYPYEIIRMLTGGRHRDEAEFNAVSGGSRLPVGSFIEYDLDPSRKLPQAISVEGRAYGENQSAIIFGLISTPTAKMPEGMQRVLILSDPTRGMGALTKAECDRVVAALDLAEKLSLPVEWLPVSSGARIAMDSGTENLDATAQVVKRIVTFTQNGGVIHIIVQGVNVGAQSYWDALSTMLMHTRGILVMTPGASMVLTGRMALAASGSVAAEDEPAIGGYERVMGPNGQAQYYAEDLGDAYQILYQHYEFTYVVPGEAGPRRFPTLDPVERKVTEFPYAADAGDDFRTVGEIFDPEKNPGRKKPFAMRSVMASLIDQDGGHLERWPNWGSAETAIVWDAHLGGQPVCLIGIESKNVSRWGYRPLDGPAEWNGGTLFPQSSKKVARAINSASGNRPIIVLANLSGFDGSPESMRKLQLEYGAEIARAVVNFQGPILFTVVSRYHGGAYVVFSQELNPSLKASALTGSYASVIGGGPAAAVVFPREVRARASADPRVTKIRAEARANPHCEERALALEECMREVLIEKQSEVAQEFDAIHNVERALRVGSLSQILEPDSLRQFLIEQLQRS